MVGFGSVSNRINVIIGVIKDKSTDRVLTDINKDIDQVTKNTNQNTRATKKGSDQTDIGRKRYKKFRMEMLSLMFAGMALSRSMHGLLDPVKKMTGETELWGATMNTFFLPYALDSLDWAIDFNEALTDLNDVTDGWAGRILGWGGAFLQTTGDVLGFVGQIGLASDGLVTIKENWKGVKDLFNVEHIMKMGRSGWSKITDVLTKLTDWGFSATEKIKEFKVKMVADVESALKALGSLSIGGVTLSVAALTGITIIASIALVWAITKATDEIRKFFDAYSLRKEAGVVPSMQMPDKFGFFRDVNDAVYGGTGAPTGGTFNDFIWRKGQGIQSINPNDNVVGFKDSFGGGGGSSFSPTINITAGSNLDIEAMKSQLTDQWFNQMKSRGMA